MSQASYTQFTDAAKKAQEPFRAMMELNLKTMQGFSYLKPEELVSVKKPEDLMEKQVDLALANGRKVLDYMENHTFNYKKLEVGTGESMQIKEFVSTISSICGGQTHLDFGAIEYRDDEIMNSQADIRGMTDLGWQPKIKPSEGIIKIIDTYSAHSKARNLV